MCVSCEEEKELIYNLDIIDVSNDSSYTSNVVEGVKNKQKRTFYNTELVKNLLLELGYILDKDEIYIKNSIKMKMTCPNGHIIYMKINSFTSGYRCLECSGSRKHTTEEVRTVMLLESYKLKSAYINNKEKLEIECPLGHIFYMNYNGFANGRRCRLCGIKKRSGSGSGAWNKNRDMVRSMRETHDLSRAYKESYRKFYNIQDKSIHIDHILPIKSFAEHNIYNIDLINDFDNLQPLEKIKNIKKSGKYILSEFYKYLESKNYKDIENAIKYYKEHK